MIDSIAIRAAFRSLRPVRCDMHALTVLVGDQGAGKSTLLSIISGKLNAPGILKLESKDHDLENSRVLYYDFERDNPRMQSNIDQSPCAAFSVASRFISHGETMTSVIRWLEETEPAPGNGLILLLDEPDTGLSPLNALRLADTLRRIAKKPRMQVIASIHNPWVISGVCEILRVPEFRWESAAEYLSKVKNSLYDGKNFQYGDTF